MKLKIGIAGVRGLSSMMGFRAIEQCEVTALCDLNGDLLKSQGDKYNIPKRYRVFEDMLNSDIDAVVISTPMQCHVPQALAALESGKHVLSEVTAGVTMDELWWLIEAKEKYDKVYMMAENYIYMPENQLILNMVKKGLFGEVYFGEGEYIHDLKGIMTYDYGLQTGGKTSWRSYWQLGKRGAFYPTHSLGPVMKWFAPDRIESISCFGVGWYTAPQFKQEDTTLTICRLKSGKMIKIRIDCVSNRPHNMTYYSLQGTRGCYEAARGPDDYPKLWIMDDCEPIFKPLTDFYDEHMPQRYKEATEEQKKAGHRGGDFFIIKDFVDAIIHGKKPEIDVYEACEWTAVGLLSELSVANGGRTMKMPDFYSKKNEDKGVIL